MFTPHSISDPKNVTKLANVDVGVSTCKESEVTEAIAQLCAAMSAVPRSVDAVARALLAVRAAAAL